MYQDKKVCGTLIENLLIDKQSFYSMIGFGFNISIPKNLINFIDGCPTNLKLAETKSDLIIGTTTSVLLKNISLYENNGFLDFQRKWNKHMYAKDKNIILSNSEKQVTGKLLGINEFGELEIEENGKIINISDINYSMRILK